MNRTAPDGPARRAVVIASQTGWLRGPDNDAELMASLLADNGFDVLKVCGRAASRAGILDAYESLIRVSRPDDAAVVYYSGHGSRATTSLPGAPSELRFILPTDIAETSANDFRGILSEELSILQWRLTTRTANVTSILDCCFSSRMARIYDHGPWPRGWEVNWPVAGVNRRWATAAGRLRELRETHSAQTWFDSNPLAVRMVACASNQRAFEDHSSDHDGAVHGYLTAALETALRADNGMTWETVCALVQHRVLALHPGQRPEAEGPIDRIVFTTDTRPSAPGHPVRVDRATGLAWLDGAHLHGIVPGDEFVVTMPGRRAGRVEAVRARVTGLEGAAALLHTEDGRPVPEGWQACLSRSARRDQTIRVAADTGPASAVVITALSGLPGISVSTDAAAGGQIATVTVADGTYLLADAAGRPLYGTARTVDPEQVRRLREDVMNLAGAIRLQTLEPHPEHDDLRADVGFTVVTVDGRPVDETVLHIGERIRLAVSNGPGSAQTVYANVLGIGVAGRVNVLNTAEPSGIALQQGERRPVGARPDRSEPGLLMTWPLGLPIDGPRFETVLAVFSDAPQDLRGLAHDGIAESGTRGVVDGLAKLFRSGRRDVALPPHTAQFALRRVTFALCPGGKACAQHRFAGS